MKDGSVSNSIVKSAGEIRRGAETPDGGSVHACRVAMKRMRALLRLLGPERCRAELHRLRRAARALAPFRDARIALDTLESIAPDSAAARAGASSLRFGLTRFDELDRGVAEARRALALSEKKAVELAEFSDERGITKAIERSARKLDTARREARQGGARLHEVRKLAKLLLYQLEACRPAGADPPRIARRLERLGEKLGAWHDLQITAELTAPIADCEGAERLKRKLGRRRRRRERKALRLLGKLPRSLRREALSAAC